MWHGYALLHYRIIDKVGEGGMGQIYHAEDTKLGRNVALKLLTADATRDQSAKRRLLSEAQSASVLSHPTVSVRAGELEAAEKHFDAASDELRDYPAPLVAWRVHAGRGRLKSKMGVIAGAEEATARATEIINLIASSVKDENLRNTFLNAARQKL